MRETKVKICDVEDFETAKRLEEIGVDFIGIHMMNEVKDKKSKLLAQCKANLRTIDPVVVTRTKNLDVIRKIIKLRPSFIQLHSPVPWSRAELKSLSAIISGSIGLIGVVAPEDRNSVEQLEAIATQCKLVLFDKSLSGGTGKLIEENQLENAVSVSKKLDLQFFVAGGLNPDNVSSYVTRFQPYGVDVQSGVEVVEKRGHNDFEKVKEFVRKAKSISNPS